MIGRMLGHYRIEAQLGAGGMGVVYRAQDTRLERTVAIKVLGDRLPADDIARARLLREARTASSLNHPNICTIHEVSETDGQTYIVMEHVEGQALSALIPTDGLPVEMVFRYGTQIADALDHAHERGIVHRDLKSSNVIVTPAGRAKVLDFGLAKRMLGRVADATRSAVSLTEAGAVAGTLAYMAPEVLRGGSADPRTDLWALGVMLYEMATGSLPFHGQTPFELSSQILREPPAQLPPRVPAGLRAITQRCLAKDPGQRNQRAGEVRSALEALQSADTVIPRASASAAVRRFSRRRWLWALMPAAMLGIGGYFSYREKTLSRSGRRLSTGAPASRHAEANDYFERAMLFLKVQYDLARARQMLERALELDPQFAEARGWYGFTHILMIDSGYSNDTALIYKAEEHVRRALQDDPNSGRGHSALAAIYLFQGRKDLMPAEAERAFQANPDDVDAYIWLNVYHQMNGDYDQALALLKKLMDREPLFAPARFNIADILRQQGDTAGAVRELQKILDQDATLIYAHLFIALAYMNQGDLAKARESVEALTERDRGTYLARLVRGMLAAQSGKRDEAVQEVNGDVLKYGESNPQITSFVAEFFALLGETSQALDWLERAVRLGDERIEWFRRDPLLAKVRDNPPAQAAADQALIGWTSRVRSSLFPRSRGSVSC